MKATAVINRGADTIMRVVGEDKYRKMYDPIYDSSSFLERIADQAFLVHHKTKGVLIVGPRDFVLIINFNKMPDGVIYATVQESGLNHLRPEAKGTVRGCLPFGGWRFTPLD